MSEEPDPRTAVSLRVVPERFGRVASSGPGEIPYASRGCALVWAGKMLRRENHRRSRTREMPPANPRTARVLPRGDHAHGPNAYRSLFLPRAAPEMNDQRGQGHQDETGELPLIERVAAQMPVERMIDRMNCPSDDEADEGDADAVRPH